MKNLLIKSSRMLVISALLALITLVAFAQEVGTAPATQSFPYILSLALIVGMMLHWAVAYIRNKDTTPFKEYFIQSFGLTISTLGVASAAFAGIYSLNPASYDTGNIGTWIAVILFGYSFDSAGNGTTFIKKQ